MRGGQIIQGTAGLCEILVFTKSVDLGSEAIGGLDERRDVIQPEFAKDHSGCSTEKR